MKNKTNQIVNALRSSAGKYFGLTTKQGSEINGRFLNETPNYVRIYDRNSDQVRTLAKTSLAAIRCGYIVVS